MIPITDESDLIHWSQSLVETMRFLRKTFSF